MSTSTSTARLCNRKCTHLDAPALAHAHADAHIYIYNTQRNVRTCARIQETGLRVSTRAHVHQRTRTQPSCRCRVNPSSERERESIWQLAVHVGWPRLVGWITITTVFLMPGAGLARGDTAAVGQSLSERDVMSLLCPLYLWQSKCSL